MGSLLNTVRRYFQPFLTEAEKQNQTVVFSSLLFLVSLVTLGLKPALSDVIKMRQEVGQGRILEKRLTEKVANLNRAIENINKLRADLSLIDRSLPENKDLPSLLTTLNLIFGSNNVAIVEMRFEGPKPSKDPKVFILPLSIRASGSYESILLTLENIERNPRQLDVTGLSVEIPNKGDRRFLNIVIDLETYFLKKLFT